MSTFGIGEIARRARVAPSTIRYYEQIGLLPPAKQVNGKRRYDLTILDKLSLIRLAQETGFTLAEIQALLNDFPSNAPPAVRWQAFAERKIEALDRLIARAAMQKAFLEKTRECSCPTLETCARTASL